MKCIMKMASNGTEYNFKTIINETGSLDFCYNFKKITYENLPEFIRQEVQVKQERMNKVFSENILNAERLELLKETLKKQKEEYLLKEKQITNFLECKKSFFGRVKYFFKKDNKTNKLKEMKQIPESEEKSIEIGSVEKIEEKDFYTIEDLLKICETLRKEELYT